LQQIFRASNAHHFWGNDMKKIILGVSLLSLAGACATPYQPTPFDRQATGVNKIIVIDDAVPAEVGTRKLATNGQNMGSAMAASAGLAGVLVAGIAAGVEAGIENGQRNRIRAAIATQTFDGEAIFDAALETALKGHGFTLETVSITRPSNRLGTVIAPNPSVETGSGILDANIINYGYQLVGGTTQWRPFVVVDVKLVDPKDPKKLLMDNAVTYNPVGPTQVTVSIAPDEKFAFQKIEDLEANPALAAEGLKAALEASAVAVGQLLK
jgi:hypothetical protein